MANEPWYKDGLKFQCTQCGNCCTGAPGFVWVNAEEILGLAEAAGLAPEEFEAKYVRKVGIRKTLKERSNGDCVLFDARTRKCTVYDARPRQCRTWPFWDSNLKSDESWRATCEVCPGSGHGRLYQLADIESQRRTFHV